MSSHSRRRLHAWEACSQLPRGLLFLPPLANPCSMRPVYCSACGPLCRRKENREKRRREAELRSTTTLGAAGDDVDDLAAWAAKIKPKSAADVAADGAADAAAGARPSKRRKGAKAAAAGSDDDDDEEEGGHTAADLQGVKVRHDLENLTEGEAVVLTLADTGTPGVLSFTANGGSFILTDQLTNQDRVVLPACCSCEGCSSVRAVGVCLGRTLCVSRNQLGTQGLMHEPLPPCAPCCQCPCFPFILPLLEPSTLHELCSHNCPCVCSRHCSCLFLPALHACRYPG